MPKLPRLRQIRDSRLLTQEALAALSQVGVATISRIESQEVAARPETVRKLARALKVKPQELMGDE